MSALTTSQSTSTSQPADATSQTKDGWSAALYGKAANFVYSSAFTSPVMNLLEPKSGERILDLGCGTGELTATLARAVGPDGYVSGVDASANMVAKAREVVAASRAETSHVPMAPVDLLVADAQTLQLSPEQEGTFDAVFSNATLHWCSRDPLAALQSAARALRPGGRFAAEMGGMGNCIGVRAAIHSALQRRGRDPAAVDPWFFPSVEEYSTLLTRAGFTIREISLVPRVTPLPEGLSGWLRMFAKHSFLGNLEEAEAEEIIKEVAEAMAVDCRDREGRWSMMYVRLRFSAVKEE
ncbi:S-adenosyl-L-methionine-dependent methyltransferase [Schizophyllum commune H4-8]|uniref:Methyltransferase domain-containing protein n=1 Tax=Schizophyllum commune (strain H4-8 / FGSC 9210) TaxID=578458 RepID=D8Q7U9_SCHCM|nr:S-adenosyl-L-methionine-dependent methyltransferase [Schizophyllum commune H4-8]KAI5891339.1 S-adenosyl-L-methionine-dependent methyltransferase [Schizophyllum commune H4-8]